MNAFVITFLLLNTAALLLLPRRWAPLPLLIGAYYIPGNHWIELGPFSFSIIRIFIGTGLVRLILRGERLSGRMNALDWLMLTWAAWMLISSLFHKDPSAALVFRLGLVYDACGIYSLVRVFCQSLDDLESLCRLTAILLIPVAIEMFYERATIHNLFYEAVGSNYGLYIRNSEARAQGPFAHSILAGTIGAVCLPLCIVLWRQNRKASMIAIVACLVIIITSGSSGPIMSAVAAIGALLMWRHRVRFVRWLFVAVYIALDLVMKDPAYYVLARIDLVGGSGGWHRARLIESAFEHLHEWWLAGTDFTRHWMPSGVSWSPDHTDITNHYLHMGVVGGLPLMLLFIAVLTKGFSFVGQTLQQMPELSPQFRVMLWALGASLFAHTVTLIAVSYFDQLFVFLYLTLAAIGSARSLTVTARAKEELAANDIRRSDR